MTVSLLNKGPPYSNKMSRAVLSFFRAYKGGICVLKEIGRRENKGIQ